MKGFLFCLFTVALLGCSSNSKKSEPSALDYPAELQAVNQLIKTKKTLDARNKVDDYLNKAENIHWYGHAYFLKAFLYELDEQYPEAIKYYRSAIQHGSNYESKVVRFSKVGVSSKMNSKALAPFCNASNAC